MIVYSQKDTFVNLLTPEGIAAAEHGSPEVRFWNELTVLGEGEGKTVKEVQVRQTVSRVGSRPQL
jgi:hypothetical protein